MWGVGEHVDRLDGHHAIVYIQIMQVACLGGRIAGDVDNALGSSTEDGLHHIRMHAGTGRVGDDDIRTSVLSNEVVGEDILHIASKEQSIVDTINLRVDLRILNSLRHIFDTDDFPCLSGHEISDGASAGIKVVDHFVACQGSELPRDAI